MSNQLKFLLLAGNTYRARAYAQTLERINLKNNEICGVFYGFDKRHCQEKEIDHISNEFFISETLFVPDLCENPKETFSNNNWHFSSIETVDLNSEDIIDSISNYSPDIVIFAGYGGQILRSKFFELPCKYLHMHPGNLPLERGSTTIYYSILNQRKCTVTSFFMSEEIDQGVNLVKSEYNQPNQNVNIDIYYDNIIRADCFGKTLVKIFNDEKAVNYQELEDEEYYVIHPVLKHVAILSLK